MKKPFLIAIILCLFMPFAFSANAATSTTTVSSLMKSLLDSTKESVYNINMNAPFGKESSGIREKVSTETGGLVVQNSILTIPGRNGMDLSINLVYNNQNAKLYDEGTKSAAISKATGYTATAYYDIYDSNGFWLATGALSYGTADSMFLAQTTINGETWVFNGYHEYPGATSLQKSSVMINDKKEKSAADAAKYNMFGIGWSLDLPSIIVDGDSAWVTLPDGQTYKADPKSVSGLAKYTLSDIRFGADTSVSNGADTCAYKLRYADGHTDYFTKYGDIAADRSVQQHYHLLLVSYWRKTAAHENRRFHRQGSDNRL